MKKYLNYILPSLLPSLMVAFAACVVGCSEAVDTDVEAGVGVKWQISLKSDSGTSVVTRADETDYSKALSNSVMKIYDTDDRLLRRYEPISDAPEYIYLTEGDYYVTITAGESLSPVDSREDITFEGEREFTVSAQATTSFSVTCSMINNAITVYFDESIEDNFEEGYSVVVAPTSEINDTVLSDTYSHKKLFTQSAITYFIQPDGETSLSWRFEGTRKLSEDVIVKTGTISDVDAGEYNYLTFSYEKELTVSNATVVVDDSTDDYNDIFEFSPQPTISGSGFSIASTQVATGADMVLNIEGIYDLQGVDVAYGDTTLTPFAAGASVDVEGGVSYEVLTSTSGQLTISNEYFSAIGEGGEQEIVITAVDIKASKTTKSLMARVTGVTGLSNFDFWANTATLSATIVDETIDAATTQFELRSKGATTWQSYSLTANADGTYTAQSAPSWSSAQTNSYGNKYYTLDEGISPSNEYECRLVVGGVARPTVTYLSDGTSQTIVNGNMDDSNLKCYTTDSSSSTDWASGNNTFSSSLCQYGSRGDAAKCAYLEATEAASVFAAGNLIYGQFKFNGITAKTGTVKFGQAFTWTARPKSIKLRYSATVGQDAMTSPTGVAYSHDRGRIYFAIVDWSSRHEVTSGSGTPSGVWDPESDMSTDEGNIIGYGSVYIDESTDSNMYDLEIPIYYYDKETKPSKSITMLISCATSAYGDYLIGSTSSRLWVDDFELSY